MNKTSRRRIRTDQLGCISNTLDGEANGEAGSVTSLFTVRVTIYHHHSHSTSSADAAWSFQ